MSLGVTLFCTLVISYFGVVGRVGGCEEVNGSLQVFFRPRTIPDNLLLSYTLFYGELTRRFSHKKAYLTMCKP